MEYCIINNQLNKLIAFRYCDYSISNILQYFLVNMPDAFRDEIYYKTIESLLKEMEKLYYSIEVQKK